MYHLDNTSGVPEMPEPKEQQSITPKWFGESVEQGGISWPGADWFNTVQAELLNLIKAAGITPDKNTFDQLSTAIPVLGDARIRKELTEPGGASIPMLLQGGSVQDALHNVINVKAFQNLNSSPDDWGPAFRGALAYCESIGGGKVSFSGHYKISSYDITNWALPFDDGSIDPARIAAGTDHQLDSEDVIELKVHLNIPSGVSLIGDGVETSSLTFSWDWDSKIIDNNQSVGICVRVADWDGTYVAKVGAKNRMTKVVINTNIGGFRINNAFIPVLADGIMVYGEWPELAFNKCAMSLLALGGEMPRFKGFQGSLTLTGPIFGGWWLQRNDLTYQGGVKVPPYVEGMDVYSLGWCDSAIVDYIKFDFPEWNDPVYRATYMALDVFFDKYIWKTRNSLLSGEKSPSGEMGTGRLSKKGADYVTTSTMQAENPFRGVSSRAFCVIPRYRRGNSGNTIGELKTRKTARPPILTANFSPSGSVVTVRNSFVEESCLTNPSLTSDRKVGGDNDWFKTGGDIWNSDLTQTPYYVGQGLVTTIAVSQAACIAAMPSNSNQGGSGSQVNTIVGPNKPDTRLSRTTLFDPASGEWSLVRESFKSYDFTPALKFSSNPQYPTYLAFRHAEKILRLGDAALFSLSGGVYTMLSPASIACKMVRIGSLVRCYFKFTLSPSDIMGNGQFVLGLRRYSVYDPSRGGSVDFAGSRCLLNVYRGSMASASAAPSTIENAGFFSVGGVSYIMFKIFSDISSSVTFPVSSLTTANQQSWLVEYESFSTIESIELA